MNGGIRMFVLGAMVGAAVTATGAFYAGTVNSKEAQGIEWSGSKKGAEISVSAPDQVYFVAGRQRQNAGEDAGAIVKPGSAFFPSQFYEEVLIFGALPMGQLSGEAFDGRGCQPCILPPPPPPGIWDLTMMTRDVVQQFRGLDIPEM